MPYLANLSEFDDAVAASGRQELPALEMPYGQFRPVSGMRDCLNGWLAGCWRTAPRGDEPRSSLRRVAGLLPVGWNRVGPGV